MKKSISGIFITFFVVINLISYAQKQFNISIKGKIINNPYKTVYLDKFDKEESTLVDSAKINNTGAFLLNAAINETGFYNLRLPDNKTLMLILTPGEKPELLADFSNFQTPTSISGSYQTELAFELNKKLNNIEQKQDSLNQIYEKYKNTTKLDSIVNILRTAYDKFSEQQKQLLKNFIKNNLSTLCGLLFINKLSIDNNFDIFIKYDSVLIKKYPDNNVVREFHEQVLKNIHISIGNIAPDIVEKDTSGNNKALSSLRGRYVLIDFWASWCGPCRRESPHMVNVYNKYHDKSFEIFSVSLDKDKKSWINAIKRDNLKWIHVSDLGYWSSAPARLYNVTSIPYTVLLDKTGKIIAKGLYGSQIDEKLNMILK